MFQEVMSGELQLSQTPASFIGVLRSFIMDNHGHKLISKLHSQKKCGKMFYFRNSKEAVSSLST